MSTKKGAAPAAEQREGLTIERYAEVMAHRRHFHPSLREEVLLRMGVQPHRWAAATKAWGAAMAHALAADEPELIQRFVQTLGRTSRRLLEFPPRLEQLGDRIDPGAPEPAARAASAEVPSYMREPLSPAAPPPPAPMPAASAPVLPSRPVAPAPPPAPRARPGLGETADISAFVPRTAMPFQSQPTAPTSPLAAPPTQGAASHAAPSTPPRPGAFLRRFDPETGEPLAVPVWEDPPEGWAPQRK